MTRDDIIRMAAECGIPEFEKNETQADNIIRFANLVAAAEREKIIALNAPEIERINEYIKTLEEAVAAEREACAKVCEDDFGNGALNLADAIRAKGKK